MAIKTRRHGPKSPAHADGMETHDGERTLAPVQIAPDTWLIPCSLLEEWDQPDSDFAPRVKHAVLDGYALAYALLGGVDAATGEPYASLALSFRPDPAIKNILLIAMSDVFKGLAHSEDGWPGFDAFRKKEEERGPTGDPIIIERTLKKNPSYYSCTVTSKFFRIEFYYDFNKHIISRFKYSPLPDLEETKTGKQRPHRKRDELPDPALSPHAEVNRYDARYQARISKDTSERVDAFLKATGMQKKDLTEQALVEFLERHGDKGDDPSP